MLPAFQSDDLVESAQVALTNTVEAGITALTEDLALAQLKTYAGKAQDILRHHKLIVKAIADGNPAEAQKHLRTHLSGTLSELAQIRARYPEYLSD